MNSCLFCAAPSSSSEKETGGLAKVKSEVFISGEDDYHSLSESGGSVQGRGSLATVNEHLKASFILNKILKIPHHSISQLLQNHFKNGEAHPPQEEEDISLSVCSSCGDSVALFYKTLEQVLELERNLAAIETELKLKMQSSSQLLVYPGSINHLIRSQVLNGPVQEASQKAFHLNHHDLIANIKSEVVDDDTMTEEDISEEEHHHSFVMVDHPDYDENDETEEPEFRLQLDYLDRSGIVQNHVIFSPSPTAERETSPKEGTTQRGKFLSYACDKCPFRSANKAHYIDHAKTHEEGSEAVPCSICEWFVFPDNMAFHLAVHHSRKKKEFEKEEKGPVQKKVGIEKQVKKAKKKRPTMYYQCPECNALICSSLADYRNHEEMHAVARGFICPDCKWLCTTLSHHRTKWHPINKELQMPFPHQIIKM